MGIMQPYNIGMKNKYLRKRQNPQFIRNSLIANYETKYYNLFMNSFKWVGVDEQERNFLMKSFYSKGTIMALKDREGVSVYFMPYSASGWNIYDYPEICMPTPKKDFKAVSLKNYTNMVDCVIGFANDSHTPIHEIVRSYIERMVDIDMTINTNLIIHKLPFFANVSNQDRQMAEDILDNLYNDEIAIFFNGKNPLATEGANTPYIIDKLYSYRVSLENELLTYLGLDNSQNGDYERMLVDQVNANNEQINASQESILTNLKDFCKNVSKVLGMQISVEPSREKVQSVHEEKESGGSDNELQ